MADHEDGTGVERRGPFPGPLDDGNGGGKLAEQNYGNRSSTDDRSAFYSKESNSSKDLPVVPKFPALHNNLPKGVDVTSQAPSTSFPPDIGLEDGSGIAEPFQRTESPTLDPKRDKGAIYEKVGDHGVCKMHKFSVYETATRYYVVGADVMDQRFRILKIDRNADVGSLSVAEDDIVYTKKEMSQLLNAVDDGNKSTGGLKLKCSTWGLLGFVRFTGPYYLLLITKRSQVAMIGGHYVYQIDGTELIPLVTAQNSRFKADSRNTEETRFLGIMNNLDLSRSFYFSYSYDITHTLQHNIMKERDALAKNLPCPHLPNYNDMFVWNNYLLRPATDALKNTYDWCLPIIHGYIDQAGMCLESQLAKYVLTSQHFRYMVGPCTSQLLQEDPDFLLALDS